MNVLSVVSEAFPLIKTGGLADVAGALPLALRSHDVAVTTLLPGYPAVMAAVRHSCEVASFDDLFGGPARLIAGQAAGLDLLVVDAPHLYDRPGNPYIGADGNDWPDNTLRFAALGWCAAQIGLGLIPGLHPDVVHGHDWQAGLTMAYLAYDGRPRPGTVLTVHNLAFQGRYASDLLAALRLPPHARAVDGVEYYGGIGFLKAGLHFADRITTVSPTYAQEIQTPEFGHGMDGLLRARAGTLVGIVNGIDIDVWDPVRDPALPAQYDCEHLAARRLNKSALQRRFGLAEQDGPLVGVISRLTWQKGLDVLFDIWADAAQGMQLVLLGTGEHDLERRFEELKSRFPTQVGGQIGYDEELAHWIQGSVDALVVPSRMEPCGLTQLCALRYGAIPVVSMVGGLKDTVSDETGIRFWPVSALAEALARLRTDFADPAPWRQKQKAGMATDVSWSRSAAAYATLYRQVVHGRQRTG